MPDDMRKRIRAGLMATVLFCTGLPLGGCIRPGTSLSTGTATLPGAPTGGSGTLPGTFPGAPTGGSGTLPGYFPGAPTGGSGTASTATQPDPFATGSNTPLTLTSTDSASGAIPGGAAGSADVRVDLRTGGRSMESGAYAWAAGAVQPRTSDPTVLRHEAVHFIDGELGGNPSWQDLSPNVARAFYIWGTDRYYVVPNTGVRKSDVLPLVPTHLTGSHQNYFYNFDFGSRDGLHLFEDFCAEIGSGEKSSLLFDMLVFSSALGLKLEQLGAGGGNAYWRRDGGAIFRGTLKAFMEMASPGLEGRLQTLARDASAPSVALRQFLVRTYGEAWTRQVLGFGSPAGASS